MRHTVCPNLGTISGIVAIALMCRSDSANIPGSPDYRELSKLRTHFPEVPILALTATCPPAVLKDILKILQLRPITPGNGKPQMGSWAPAK